MVSGCFLKNFEHARTHIDPKMPFFLLGVPILCTLSRKVAARDAVIRRSKDVTRVCMLSTFSLHFPSSRFFLKFSDSSAAMRTDKENVAHGPTVSGARMHRSSFPSEDIFETEFQKRCLKPDTA